MYEYIKGKLEYTTEDYIVIDVQGIGYKIFTSQNTIKSINNGMEIKAFTHLIVKEDDLVLYGFSSREELKMFKLLISISGVGPKAAVSLLSQAKPYEISTAIITKNIGQITKAPGIGKKIAERIILELKDKIDTESALPSNDNICIEDDTSQAIEALMALGYNYNVAASAIAKIQGKEKSIDVLIKEALKYIGNM